jgi:uncharacterized protein YcfJ
VKRTIKCSIDAIIGFRKSRPKQFRWSIYGAAVGAFVGAFIGGVGVAALGVAFGMPAFIILAIVGGMIGNRVGVEKDNAARSQRGH